MSFEPCTKYKWAWSIFIIGIGQGRVTNNVEGSPVDYALLIKDTDAVRMVRIFIPNSSFILSPLPTPPLLKRVSPPLAGNYEPIPLTSQYISHVLCCSPHYTLISFPISPTLFFLIFNSPNHPPPTSHPSLSFLALVQTFYLLHEEGFFVGASTGLNVAAAVQVAKDLGPGHTVVTCLCDSGQVCG